MFDLRGIDSVVTSLRGNLANIKAQRRTPRERKNEIKASRPARYHLGIITIVPVCTNSKNIQQRLRARNPIFKVRLTHLYHS